MPIITGKGIPAGIGKGTEVYDQLKRDIAAAVAVTPGLNDITPEEVIVFLQPDLGTVGNGLVFEVSGIFRRDDRGPQVWWSLREQICKVLRSFAYQWLPKCTTVEAEIAWTMEAKELSLFEREAGSRGRNSLIHFQGVRGVRNIFTLERKYVSKKRTFVL